MQSPVNWALLGLVIERPSYAYELARRFERAYDGALSLSSTSHAYTALGTLRSRGMIEEIAGTRGARQPKPRYRATAKGVEDYREWLVSQAHEDRRRQRLLVLQIAALSRRPDAALETVERYERACLEEARRLPAAPPQADRTGAGTAQAMLAGAPDADRAETSREPEPESDLDLGLTARLLAEENRLALEAKLQWVEYTRRELKALLEPRVPRP
jgi:DNA-binding PadR family transcriptional regulator